MASLFCQTPFKTVVRFQKIFRKYSFVACRDYIEEALDQSKANDIDFVPFRIRQYVLGNKFSNANVNMVPYLEDIDGYVRDPSSVTGEELGNGNVFTASVKFSSLFQRGFDCLQKKYSDNIDEKREIIDDQLLLFAIQSFVTVFLLDKDHHERCLRSVHETSDERKITVLLANHLFSRLAATTPGGTELLFYGKPDIMVFPYGGSCSIVLPKEKKEEKYLKHEEQLNEEKKEQRLLRDRTNVSQFVSQAITFSFYQKQFQLRRPYSCQPLVTMIPSVAISDSCFDIYLYDTEHDILFRNAGDPIRLWNNLYNSADASLNLGAILQLWMLVNHLSIKPKLTQEQIEKFSRTCGFTSTLPHDRLKKIETNVKMRTKFLDHEIQEIKAPKMSLKSKYLKSSKHLKLSPDTNE